MEATSPWAEAMLMIRPHPQLSIWGSTARVVQKQIDDMAAGEGLSADDARAKLLGEKQPSLEFATPEQIGALAVFLCSDAAAQIRGAALPVDGGWTAQ